MNMRLTLIGFILLIFLLHPSDSYSQEYVVTNAEIMRVLVKISGDIESLKAEIKRLDGRIDETNRGIDELKASVKSELTNFRWFVGTFLSVFAVIIGGLLVAILSYVFRLARELRPKEAASEPEPTISSRLEKLEAAVETLRLALGEKGILEPGTTSSEKSQS